MSYDIARAFAAAVATDPTKPLLTWYDDTTGDRTELSGATLDNWVAKTANLLVDSAGLAPGDRAGVLLPPHWQTAAVLLGCWTAGLSVGWAWPAGPSVGWAEPEPVDVLFVAADRVADAAAWPADERYALALAPMAAPIREVPPGFADYVVEVRGHGDHFPGPAGGSAPDDGLRDRAARRATDLGITERSRVLIDAARHPDPVDWLLAPLLVGASVVLCAGLDPDKLTDRLAAERVQVALT